MNVKLERIRSKIPHEIVNINDAFEAKLISKTELKYLSKWTWKEVLRFLYGRPKRRRYSYP